MNRTRNAALLAGIGLLVALLVSNAFVSYRNTGQLDADAGWVAHTHEVQTEIAGVLRTLVDAETGYRGFAATGKDVFLEPYTAALASLPERTARLRSLTADSASQQQRLARLDALSASVLGHMEEGIALQREKGAAAAQAFLATGEGKRRMDAIRQLVGEMNAEEDALLKDREGQTRDAYAVAVTTSLVVVVLGLLAVGGCVWLFEHHQRSRTRAAAIIHRERGTLRATLASIGDGVIVADAQGRVTFLNGVAQQLTGWTLDDARGRPLGEVFYIVNEQTRSAVDNPALRCLRDGAIVGLANHTVLIARDGTERPIDDSAAPIRDGSDDVGGAVLVFRDVTERRRAESALRESEERLAADLEAMTRLYDLGTRLLACADLRTALDDLLDGAIRVSGADFGNVQLYNPEARALEIVAQRGFRQDFLEYFRFVRVDEGSCCARAMADGERVVIDDVELDPTYAPHRQVAAAAGYRAVQSTPLKSRTGAVLGILSTHFRRTHRPSPRDERFLDLYARLAADLIERTRADAALRKQADRLRLLWETAGVLLTAAEPDAMLRELFAKIAPHFGLDTYFNFLLDEAGGALRLASCAGVPDETAQAIRRLEFGQAVCGTVALQRRPIVATHIQQSQDAKVQLVKSFGIRAYACNPLLAGDRLLGTLSFASRRRDDFDADELEFLETVCRYVAAAYERRLLIEHLRHSDRMKDEFLAMLAHELRNPLAPVRNALEVMKRVEGDRELMRQARATMERQVGHMVKLIDDLLEVSRISRGRLELEKERVELAAVLAHAVEQARPHAERAGLDLDVTTPPEPVYLDGDPVRLAQVFANLLNNACKFTESGGHIRLTAERQGSDVTVSVRDSGIGIPPDQLTNVFEMFTQVDRSLERTRGGLGIGLTLAKRLVEMHGGSIGARSDGVGQGSEFIVRLPVLLEAGPQPPEPTRSAGRTPAAARRFLVADDNRDAADSLALLLGLAGHEVHTAYDGQEAVDAAARLQPDVILLDIGMPRLNGYDAARRIRAQPWGRAVLLVALTGWGQDEDRHNSRQAGFDGHLVKPVDPAALEKLLGGLPVAAG